MLATTFFKLTPGTTGAAVIASNFGIYTRYRTLRWAAACIATAGIAIGKFFVTRGFSRLNHDESHSSWPRFALLKYIIRTRLTTIKRNFRYLSACSFISRAGAIFILSFFAETEITPVS